MLFKALLTGTSFLVSHTRTSLDPPSEFKYKIGKGKLYVEVIC